MKIRKSGVVAISLRLSVYIQTGIGTGFELTLTHARTHCWPTFGKGSIGARLRHTVTNFQTLGTTATPVWPRPRRTQNPSSSSSSSHAPALFFLLTHTHNRAVIYKFGKILTENCGRGAHRHTHSKKNSNTPTFPLFTVSPFLMLLFCFVCFTTFLPLRRPCLIRPWRLG